MGRRQSRPRLCENVVLEILNRTSFPFQAVGVVCILRALVKLTIFGNPFYSFSRNSCFHTASALSCHSSRLDLLQRGFPKADVLGCRQSQLSGKQNQQVFDLPASLVSRLPGDQMQWRMNQLKHGHLLSNIWRMRSYDTLSI